jgi:hypothetical protein
MRRLPPVALALPLLLAACATPPEGVWIFYVTLVPDDDTTCSRNVSHDFSDAYEPGAETADEDDPWTGSEVVTESEWVFFGLITPSSPGEATLVTGGLIYPGARQDDGTWLFSWASSKEDTILSRHEDGYEFTSSSTSDATTTFDLGAEGDDGFDGSLTWEDASVAGFVESDTWSEKVAAAISTTGQIPVADYLVVDDGKGGEKPATNSYDVEECTSETCTLNATETCLRSYAMRSEPTGLDEPEDYDGIDGANQPAGVP